VCKVVRGSGGTLRTVIACVVCGLLIGCGKDRVDTIAALSGDETAGADVFQTCVPCHGADGSGGTGNSLIERAPVYDKKGLITYIIDGGVNMPPQSSLDDQEVADVVAYVRAEFGGK
jgi:mono/diheme cytochrome c family protein